MLDQAFREKGERLTDEPKERCSREVDHRAVIDQSEEDPSMSCRMLAGETRSEMSSIPPGDINTQPNSKIVFNAPYDDKHTYHIKIINASGRRIGWAIKTTNMKRLGVDPACGVLDPKEATLMAVSCDTFEYGREDTNNDRITVEWCNTPEGAAKQFRREWFQGDDSPQSFVLAVLFDFGVTGAGSSEEWHFLNENSHGNALFISGWTLSPTAAQYELGIASFPSKSWALSEKSDDEDDRPRSIGFE
ncbi:hypothetical protein KIN20_011709 [Parelaphostrongylus tenuis]|uniref:Major sperm protein n=1 Tax=Parelaphostrongylus tenuis TaxID=148309 RepID=A0AAD5MEG9_PARTN|nr:hypothetical protein KIN20_011709 [Parelaphostrongylus tenuis]